MRCTVAVHGWNHLVAAVWNQIMRFLDTALNLSSAIYLPSVSLHRMYADHRPVELTIHWSSPLPPPLLPRHPSLHSHWQLHCGREGCPTRREVAGIRGTTEPIRWGRARKTAGDAVMLFLPPFKLSNRRSPCLSGCLVGGVAHWFGRRSSAGGLFLPCARSTVDRWPLCG